MNVDTVKNEKVRILIPLDSLIKIAISNDSELAIHNQEINENKQMLTVRGKLWMKYFVFSASAHFGTFNA